MERPGAASVARSRRSSASMSLQPAIPWQVALPQGLPPLHRPGSECAKVILPVENFAANGEHGLNCLCQPRGQPQYYLYKDLTVSAHPDLVAEEDGSLILIKLNLGKEDYGGGVCGLMLH